MKKPKTSTIIIAVQCIVIIACLAFLGRALYQKWALKQTAKMLAREVGCWRAGDDFGHGRRWLYEMKLFKLPEEGTVPTDGVYEPTGRHDGPYEIVAVLTDGEYEPADCIGVRQAMIDAYNERARQLYKSPNAEHLNSFGMFNAKTNSPALQRK